MALLTWRKSCEYINHVKERTHAALLLASKFGGANGDLFEYQAKEPSGWMTSDVAGSAFWPGTTRDLVWLDDGGRWQPVRLPVGLPVSPRTRRNAIARRRPPRPQEIWEAEPRSRWRYPLILSQTGRDKQQPDAGS